MIREAIRIDAKAISDITKLNGDRISVRDIMLLLKSDKVVVFEEKEIIIGFCIYAGFKSIIKVLHWGFHPDYECKQQFIDMIDHLRYRAKNRTIEILIPDTRLDIHLGLRGVGFTAEVYKKDNSLYKFSYEPSIPEYVA